MKEIKLTQGKVALVDEEDYEYLNQWKWYAWYGGKTFYAIRNLILNGEDKKIAMHRVIMRPSKKMQVDHIDLNGLNNQKSNLRVCTLDENRRNTRARGKLKSLGVSMAYGKYRAQIKHGKVIHLGMFNTEEEAAIAYDEAAKKYHGEFANLNFK